MSIDPSAWVSSSTCAPLPASAGGPTSATGAAGAAEDAGASGAGGAGGAAPAAAPRSNGNPFSLVAARAAAPAANATPTSAKRAPPPYELNTVPAKKSRGGGAASSTPASLTTAIPESAAKQEETDNDVFMRAIKEKAKADQERHEHSFKELRLAITTSANESSVQQTAMMEKIGGLMETQAAKNAETVAGAVTDMSKGFRTQMFDMNTHQTKQNTQNMELILKNSNKQMTTMMAQNAQNMSQVAQNMSQQGTTQTQQLLQALMAVVAGKKAA